MKLRIFIILFLTLPTLVFSQSFPFEVSYPNLMGITMPSLATVVEDPGLYISYIYRASIILGVILALFSFVLGAFLYVFSVGNIGKQMEARERIFGSIAGVLLLLSSFIILRTLNPAFVNINPVRPMLPYTEIPEGVWLCNEEIVVTPRADENFATTTFEMYIQSRFALKKIWQSLTIDEQRSIHRLFNEVASKCFWIETSKEIPGEFKRARFVYIIGNYGAVFHSFPNFKGPFNLITIQERLLNAELFDPEVQDDLPNFSTFVLEEHQVPNFSVTLFEDFRLNYLDFLFSQVAANFYPYQPHMENYATSGTTTFYTYRNFHEDLKPEYRQETSICPSFRTSSSGANTQPCLKSFGFQIENFATTTNRRYALTYPNGAQFNVDFRVGLLSVAVEEVQLDSCYSLQIIVPPDERFEGKSWWLVITRGYRPTPLPTPPPNIPFRIWAMEQPFWWGEVFDKSDRGFEDNYISYFCEDKMRHKRNPCVGSIIVLPGRIIKEVEQ